MATGDINIKALLDSTQVDTSILGLKKSIRELSAVKVDLLPKAQADAVRARMGELINQSKDLKQSISSLDSGDFAQNTAKLLTPLVGGFTAAGAAAELLGIESEGLNKILQKTQQITIGLMAIQQIADSDKLKSTALYVGMQIKSFFWTGAQTKATVGATIAQRALNIAMSLNPIGLIITALATLIGLLLIFTGRSDDAAEAQKELNTAMDGTVFSSEEAKKSYEKLVGELQDLQVEYRLLSGEITEAEAKTIRLNKAQADQKQIISDEYTKKLRDLWNDYNTIWRLPAWLGGMSRSEYEAQYKLITEERDKIQKAQEEKSAQEIENVRIENEKKAEEERKKRAKEAAEASKKAYEDYVKSLKDIDAKYIEHLKKIKDYTKGIQQTIKDFAYEQLSDFEKSQQDLINQADKTVEELNTNFENTLNERISLLNTLDQRLKLLLEKPLLNKNEIEKTKKQIADLNIEIEKMMPGGGDYQLLQGNLKLVVAYFNKLVKENEVQTGLDKWATSLKRQLQDIDRYKNMGESGRIGQEYFGPMDDDSINKVSQYFYEIDKINQSYKEGSISLETYTNVLLDLENRYKNIIPYIIKYSVVSKKRGYEQVYRLKDLASQEEEVLRKQIEITREYYDGLKQTKGLSIDDIKDLDYEMQQKLTELVVNFDARWKSIKDEVKDSILEVLGQVSNAVGEIFSRSISDKFDKLNYMLDKELDNRQKALEIQLENGLITQQQYDDESEKLQEDNAQRELDLKIRQFKQEKALAMTQIVIDTALAVAKSWGQGGGLFGLPLSTLAATAGALQLAVVASQQPPEFEQGGLIVGNSHMNGGVPLIAEGNEYIVNKSAVARPGMLNLLENINKGNTSSILDEASLEKIVSRIARIPVINIESDTTSVQRRVINIETRSVY